MTIADMQIAPLSLSFLAYCVTMFVQPSARMVTTKSQLLLTFLLLCQSRLVKICMSATLVSLETRQASYKSCLQEWLCFFPNSTLNMRHVHILFRLCSKSFLSLHPPLISWSQRWQPSRFRWVLLHIGRERGFASAPSSGGSVDSLLCSIIDILRSCETEVWTQIFHMAGYSYH